VNEEQTVDYEQELADDIVGFAYDPLGFVKYAYPWGEGDLQESQGPRKWQAEAFEHIGKHLQNPETRFSPCQVGICSGHGIGKSSFIAMLDSWAMSCFEDARVVITANTATQLDTKTSPEAATWFRRLINTHWFDVKQTAIKVRDKAHEKTWRTDFIPWSKENPEAFAGLHNKGRIVLIIFDEASGIHEIIWQTIAGALSDEDTIIIWVACGNPTQNSGRFHEIFGRLKHRWFTKQIDSRTVEGTNKEQIQKDLEDFGEDSDFFRVRWRGEFPRAGSNQFIPSDKVALCRKYKAQAFDGLPKIMAVDVARFGDDQTVIGMRQGRKYQTLAKLRGLDTVQVAERVIALKQKHSPDAVVVDGDGIGAGVVDQMKHRKFSAGLFEFHGGLPAQDPAMYFNRRAEIWGAMRDALDAGMEIPDDPELETDLTGLQYGFSSKQQIQLERKEDMKKRGLSSPDNGDTLAMTFAVQIAAKPKPSAPPIRRASPWS
jgi:hypothetical protein